MKKLILLFGVIGGALGYYLGTTLPPSTIQSLLPAVLYKVLSIPPGRLSDPNFKVDFRIAVELALIFGFFFSIPAAIVIEVIKLTRKRGSGKQSTEKNPSTPAVEKRIEKEPEVRSQSEAPINPECEKRFYGETAIIKFVQTEYVSQSLLASTMASHKVLYYCNDMHFRDPLNTYHLSRKADLFEVLSNSDSIKYLCKELADTFKPKGKDILLFCKKGDVSDYLTNDAFAALISSLTGIPSSHLIYDEERRTIRYEMDTKFDSTKKALEGQNVVLLESLLLFPHTMTDMIKGVQDLGARVKKVVILMDATSKGKESSFTDFQSLGIKKKDIKVGVSVRMNLCPAGRCTLCGKEQKNLQVLRYTDYY